MHTSLQNAVFIRHIVHHQGVSGGGFTIATPASLEKMTSYVGRENEFEWKGGVDREPTLEDKQLESQKRFSQDLRNTLQYAERSGPYANRNPEQPMSFGEVSGGHLWGQHGLVDSDAFIKAVVDSRSNVVASVFTVSREWATELHLTTKAEFQTFLRAHWTSFAERWNVIPPGKVEWCAEFHTDADMSVHCHVITFDRSGTFTGAMQIPHDVIETSKQEIRKAVFAEYQAEKNIVKDLARGLCINQIKLDLGMPVSRTVEMGLERKALEAKIDLSLVKPSKEHLCAMEAKLTSLAEMLPETGQGRLGAYSVSKEVREASFVLFGELRDTNPVIFKAFSMYESSVEVAAEILGKTAGYREVYIERQMNDLKTRAANVILRAAGSINAFWERDASIKESFNQVIESGKAATTREIVHEAVHAQDLVARILLDKAFSTRLEEFNSLLVARVEEIKGHALFPEQEQRLLARADGAISKKLEEIASYKIDSSLRFNLERVAKTSIATSTQQLLLRKQELYIPSDTRKAFEQAYNTIKDELTHDGKPTSRAINDAARVLLSIPEVTANIEKVIAREVANSGRSVPKLEHNVIENRMNLAKQAIEAQARTEIKQENQVEVNMIRMISALVSSLLSVHNAHGHVKAHEAAHARLVSKSLELEHSNNRSLGN